MKLERRLSAENIFGSSPPAVFIGSWNYPKVLAGPLVPPVLRENTSIMERALLSLTRGVLSKEINYVIRDYSVY
jgi:hypothetical protein